MAQSRASASQLWKRPSRTLDGTLYGIAWLLWFNITEIALRDLHFRSDIHKKWKYRIYEGQSKHISNTATLTHTHSPVGLCVVLEQLFLQRLDAHKPRAHSAADQRRVRAVCGSKMHMIWLVSISGLQNRFRLIWSKQINPKLQYYDANTIPTTTHRLRVTFNVKLDLY